MILVEVFGGNCLPGGSCAWGYYHMGSFYQWRGGGGDSTLTYPKCVSSNYREMGNLF